MRFILDYNRLRNDPDYRNKFLHWSKWRTKREVILARDEYLCVKCLERGILTPAVDVDHIKELKDYPELCLVDSNLQSLCKSCHSKKTYNQNAYVSGPSVLGNPYHNTELRPL